eukprot:m.717317 g.717317  ORF g.717317 m.717317 type:complete len:58 (+) comp22986_c0_seq16:1055-1228(+)
MQHFANWRKKQDFNSLTHFTTWNKSTSSRDPIATTDVLVQPYLSQVWMDCDDVPFVS